MTAKNGSFSGSPTTHIHLNKTFRSKLKLGSREYEHVSAAPQSCFTKASSEEAASKRAPGDASNSQVFEKRHKFTFLFAVGCVMEVLHADEGGEVVGDSIVLHLVDW